jgi:Ca-activated chloride channel family protein
MFTVRTDRPLLPTEPAERLLRVVLHVPRPDGAARTPVHLSLVIDRSGSMAGEKLRLALHAARQAVRSLQPGDRFSVVTFDHEIDVPVPSTEATPDARLRAEAALDAVTSRGNTDLGGGWLRGCAEIGAHLPDDAIGRCFLLTDGQANHGITSPEELTRWAREQRMRRVTTSTLGLGDGFNESLLGRMSEEGGGNFYFAEHADQIPGFVARELGEVLSVVARDAALVIQAPEGVEVESLNDYPCSRDGTTLSFSLGSLSAGAALAPTFRVRFPGGPAGEQVVAIVQLTDRDGALPKTPCIQSWTRATPEEVVAQEVDVAVIRGATVLDAARAHRAALELNSAGKWKEAAGKLADAAARIRGYAAGDRESLDRADRLEVEKSDYSRRMSSVGMKDRHFRALMAMKMRTPIEPEGRVVAFPTTTRLAALARTATQALSGAAGAPTFDVDTSLMGYTLSPDTLTQSDEGKLRNHASSDEPGAVNVVLVELPHADAWFSHWHARELVAVVSLAGLDRLITLPPASFVAYELVLYGLRALQAGYEPAKLLHDDTRACLFDLCASKPDVAIKLQAGHICAGCLHRLADIGFDRDEVAALWRRVQGLAQPAASPGAR